MSPGQTNIVLPHTGSIPAGSKRKYCTYYVPVSAGNGLTVSEAELLPKTHNNTVTDFESQYTYQVQRIIWHMSDF